MGCTPSVGKGSVSTCSSEAVWLTGSVIASKKHVSVNVGDLDSFTEMSEIIEALDKILGGPSDI